MGNSRGFSSIILEGNGKRPNRRMYFQAKTEFQKTHWQGVAKCRCKSDQQNKYVFAPADKAPNNIIIICKRYYIETLIKALELDNCFTPTGNSTYTSCQMSSEDIVNPHDTFMRSLCIELSDDDKRLPYIYWTPKLHKSPVKHRF